ncbi:hypothetical protein BpHYR1_004932 [Brachionus plicatilis]|uniref:Uncharacterized protein n=1 Tax=Brachionus plicatilis TaxID=10195 RepID=A0A3M7S0V6_BRAPC|nr:hypothetical protein BpHYR1_004932 [Brachionus plicatilis]
MVILDDVFLAFKHLHQAFKIGISYCCAKVIHSSLASSFFTKFEIRTVICVVDAYLTNSLVSKIFSEKPEWSNILAFKTISDYLIGSCRLCDQVKKIAVINWAEDFTKFYDNSRVVNRNFLFRKNFAKPLCNRTQDLGSISFRFFWLKDVGVSILNFNLEIEICLQCV